MTQLKKEVGQLRKELGKPQFTGCISSHFSWLVIILQSSLALLGIAVAVLFWWRLYESIDIFAYCSDMPLSAYGDCLYMMDEHIYWNIFISLLFSFTLLQPYALYRYIFYKTYAFVGDKGIAVLKVKRREDIVVSTKVLRFEEINDVFTGTERLYSVGVGRRWVEFIEIKKARKTFLKINEESTVNFATFKQAFTKAYKLALVRKKWH